MTRATTTIFQKYWESPKVTINAITLLQEAFTPYFLMHHENLKIPSKVYLEKL